ncbi:hypothetical protein [Clostridium disporicum]|uniref:hypothetical protein n=1 Tax=Clostridium disporicum TaxID=84024 RepID=UPI0034A1D97F
MSEKEGRILTFDAVELTKELIIRGVFWDFITELTGVSRDEMFKLYDKELEKEYEKKLAQERDILDERSRIAESIEEGRKFVIKFTKNALKLDFDISQIAEVTGLTIDEVLKIKEEENL